MSHFSPETCWVRAATLSQLKSDYPTAARVRNIPVALHLVNGAVYATGDICSHALANLSDGHLEDWEVVCPLHGGSFDVRTGEAIRSPCKDAVAVYPVRVTGDEVFISVQQGVEP